MSSTKRQTPCVIFFRRHILQERRSEQWLNPVETAVEAEAEAKAAVAKAAAAKAIAVETVPDGPAKPPESLLVMGAITLPPRRAKD